MSQRELLPRLELWTKGKAVLERQIARLEAQKRTLEYWRDLSISADALCGTCREFDREGFYYVSLGRRGKKKANRAFKEIIARWIEYMPEASYWGIFDAEAVQEGRFVTLDCGFGVRESCAAREKLEMPESAAYYPPQACVQTVVRCQTDMEALPPEAFEHVRTYARRHGIQVGGIGHWHFLQLSEEGGGFYTFSLPIKM